MNEKYSDDFKRELDNRPEEYLKGGELLTEEEVKVRIDKIQKGGEEKEQKEIKNN